MESVNFILIFSFEQKSIFFHWNHNPKEIRNVIFHYLGNGGGRKITHQKWKRCLISLYGLTYSRTDSLASFYVAVSIILVCGKIKWTKAGNISFLCYFGRLPSLRHYHLTRILIKTTQKYSKTTTNDIYDNHVHTVR